VIRKPRLPDAPVPTKDGLLASPAVARNLLPILRALLPALPREGRLLELASGTGEHLAAIAVRCPGLECRPTEPDPERRAAIATRAATLPNMAEPLGLDACRAGWASEHGPVEAVMVVNLLHLVSHGELSVLLDESARALSPGGLLAIYGPFLRHGEATSAGDRAFDAHLRGEDPTIGYKDVDDVTTVLEVLGLAVERRELPANNLLLLARRAA
jgi:hypothetical protein